MYSCIGEEAPDFSPGCFTPSAGSRGLSRRPQAILPEEGFRASTGMRRAGWGGLP